MPDKIYTYDHCLTLVFISDDSNEGLGFLAKYTTTDNNETRMDLINNCRYVQLTQLVQCFAWSMIFSCYKIWYGLNVHVFVQSCAIYSCNITHKRCCGVQKGPQCSHFLLGNLSEKYYLHIFSLENILIICLKNMVNIMTVEFCK